MMLYLERNKEISLKNIWHSVDPDQFLSRVVVGFGFQCQGDFCGWYLIDDDDSGGIERGTGQFFSQSDFSLYRGSVKH